MNGLIGVEIIPATAGVVVLDDLAMERLDLTKLGVGHARCGQFADRRVQDLQHFEMLDDVLDSNRGDDGASAGLQLDQPLDSQHLQGLPHRRAGDVQLPAELGLEDALAGLELSLQDQFAEDLDDMLMQRSALQRPRRKIDHIGARLFRQKRHL